MGNYGLQKYVFSHGELNAFEKLLLLALIWHRNEITGQCFPSRETLSKETGMSVRSVSRTISKLIEKQVLKVFRQVGGSNRYVICTPATVAHGRDRLAPKPLSNHSAAEVQRLTEFQCEIQTAKKTECFWKTPNGEEREEEKKEKRESSS